MPVNQEAIRFEFVSYGVQVDPRDVAKDTLYLDVGNALGPGVIDGHHLAAHSGSAARLVLQNPELVLESQRVDRNPADPFTIVLHEWPDLDCVASAYLASQLLTTGEFPGSVDALVQYVDATDSGNLGVTQENPHSLYAAYMLTLHDQGLEVEKPKNEMWIDAVQTGLKLIDFVLKQIDEHGVSILEADAFKCPGIFRQRDRQEIERDLSRYTSSLNDPAKCPRKLELTLPTQFGGSKEVSSLLIRDVQNAGDTERCIFFKDWARSDKDHAPKSEGFVALSVFLAENEHQTRRAIISVKPNSTTTLKGLGPLLETAESAKRTELFGTDDRATDPETGIARPKRTGFDNSDPWYDGRAQNFTIVDAPRGGTVLTADEIEEIFIKFGKASSQHVEPLKLPSPGDESSSSGVNDDTLKSLTFLVESWRNQPEVKPKLVHPEVFISYSRRTLDWVEQNIYSTLVSWRGQDSIFFDKRTLEGGMGWLDELASAVSNCRVFLPIYSRPYFESDFCQWELQLAVVRDPTGRKRIIIPLILEEVELPAYCRLIQAEMAANNELQHRLLAALASVLDSGN